MPNRRYRLLTAYEGDEYMGLNSRFTHLEKAEQRARELLAIDPRLSLCPIEECQVWDGDKHLKTFVREK